MSLRKLRRQCEQRLATLEVPQPFSVESFAEHLASTRGRPISILPMPLPLSASGELCGLWAAARTRDVVYVREGTLSLHRDAAALHELAHILCEHTPQLEMSDEDCAALAPSLQGELVRMMLGRRQSYGDQQEQEAEMLATAILARYRRETTSTTAGDNEPLSRAARALC